MNFESYAQNGEDVLLWRALGDVESGFYIDVGANDPELDSVTKAFYDRGWRGINIEPIQAWYNRLVEARPRDINLMVAAGERAGTQTFYDIIDTGLSTSIAEIAEGHRASGWTTRECTVPVLKLDDICESHSPSTIHFLKVDVEGAEQQVLNGLSLDRWRPWIILVEATKPLSSERSDASYADLLSHYGFRFVYFDGISSYFVAAEHEDLVPRLAIQPNFFDKYEKHGDRLRRERLAVVESELRSQQGIFADRERAIAELSDVLRESQAQAAAVQGQVTVQTAALSNLSIRLEESQAREAALQKHLAECHARSVAVGGEIGGRDAEILRLHSAVAGLAGELSRLERTSAVRLLWVLGRYEPAALPGREEIKRPRLVRLGRKIARKAKTLRKRLKKRWRKLAVHSDGPRALDRPDQPSIMRAEPRQLRDPFIASSLRRAVHQFHSGSCYGDAITNSMILTQRILRGLGYQSEIYVEHRDPRLEHCLNLLDDIPSHEDYVLIMRHSLGYVQAERIASLPAPKIMLYHNITPTHLLTGDPNVLALSVLGREQLDFWQTRVSTSLADSEYNALELRRHGYESVFTCPLLFDVDALRARAKTRADTGPESPFTVLFVGRIVQSKGQVDLVDAFAEFRRQYKRPCRLVLVGRGDHYLNEVQDHIIRNGLERDVELAGHISDDELAAWYDRADVFASFSYHEGFGVPLIEAMAHDVPVVARATGAIPFTLGEAGVLVESRESGEMASALLRLASDPDHRVAVLEGQRRNLHRFELRRQIPNLLQALALGGACIPVEAETRDVLLRNVCFTVIGHVNNTYSLASVNRSMTLALEAIAPGRARVQPVEGVQTLDLSGVPPTDLDGIRLLANRAVWETGPHVVISHHYPVHVPEGPHDLLLAYFFWEESLIPWKTVEKLNNSFRAILAPSRFVAKALVDSGVAIPVRVIGYAPVLEKFVRLYRERTDMGKEKGKPFTFLHVSSAFPRKGVDLLLAAYARAFSRGENVQLVVKCFPNPHNETAMLIERLRREHPEAGAIVLVDGDIEEDQLLQLYRDADAMVLPSRGEGFNIPAAEAMAAGIPLVVTGGGGHVDFVTDKDARLLKYRIERSHSHLAEGQSAWLAPDPSDLEAALREIFNDAAAGGAASAERVTRAREAVAAHLDRPAFARRIAETAVDLLLMPPPSPLRTAWVTSWDVQCGIAEYTRYLLTELAKLLGRDTELVVLSDDRTAARNDGQMRAQPAWERGNNDSLEDLARIISKLDPHVVSIQHQDGLIRWAGLIRLLRDRRLLSRVVVVTLHNTRGLLEMPLDERQMIIAGLRLAARIIVHTIADLNLLLDLGLAANVVLMPHGAPSSGNWLPVRKLPTTARTLIGCYGFLLPHKGVRRLIEALALLRKERPSLRLRLVNALYPVQESPEELVACRALAQRLGVYDCIEWITDFLPLERSVALLQECDLLVLPYEDTPEASSAALRSALVSGTPIAVTPVPIFEEADEAVARLAGDDAASIADGIGGLLRDVEARERLQVAARAWLEQHSWALVAQRMYGMLNGLIAEKVEVGTEYP